MNKTKTNISVKTNTGSRRKVDVIAGDNGPYVSGDILDANATKHLVDKYATKQELNAEIQRAQAVEAAKANTTDLATVATTGSYNDLIDKPTIPNVAVVNLEMQDFNTSTNPVTLINQDKISQICDLLDAGTVVFGTTTGNGAGIPGIYTVMPSDSSYTLYMNAFTAQIQSSSTFGSWDVFCKADVTSRYVASNTEP